MRMWLKRNVRRRARCMVSESVREVAVSLFPSVLTNAEGSEKYPDQASGHFDLIYLDLLEERRFPETSFALRILRPKGILLIRFQGVAPSSFALPKRAEFRRGHILTLAFSRRTLSPLGPPLKSIVRTKSKFVGRIVRVSRMGVEIHRVSKQGNSFRARSGRRCISFDDIEYIREPEPRLCLHKRKSKSRRRRRRCKKRRVFQIGDSVYVNLEGILWNAKVFKMCGLDGYGVVLKFTDGTYQTFLETHKIFK